MIVVVERGNPHHLVRVIGSAEVERILADEVSFSPYWCGPEDAQMVIAESPQVRVYREEGWVKVWVACAET